MRPILDYRPHSPMPGRAPGPPNRQADNQRTVGSGLALSRPSAPGASGQHSHPSLAGWALESPVCTSRSIWSKEGSWDVNPEGPASTLLPAPPIVNPTALSKDTSEAVQLSWLLRNCTDPAALTPGPTQNEQPSHCGHGPRGGTGRGAGRAARASFGGSGRRGSPGGGNV